MDKENIKNIIRKRKKHLRFEKTLAWTIGGVELMVQMDIDSLPIWIVRSGDHYEYFDVFEKALDYYVENDGTI